MIQLLELIISALFKTVDKVVDSKEEKDRIKAKIQEQALAGEMKEISTAANIILQKQRVKVGLLVRGDLY